MGCCGQFYDTAGHKRRETYSTEAKARKMLTRRLAQKDAGMLESSADARVRIDVLAESYKLYAQNSAPKS